MNWSKLLTNSLFWCKGECDIFCLPTVVPQLDKPLFAGFVPRLTDVVVKVAVKEEVPCFFNGLSTLLSPSRNPYIIVAMWVTIRGEEQVIFAFLLCPQKFLLSAFEI